MEPVIQREAARRYRSPTRANRDLGLLLTASMDRGPALVSEIPKSSSQVFPLNASAGDFNARARRRSNIRAGMDATPYLRSTEQPVIFQERMKP